MATANDVLKVAKSQLGYRETPSGSNKTKYGKEYGMNAVPWCAIFVWYVFKHAGCPEEFYGGGKCAYCPSIADYYIEKKQTVSKSSGKAGDIVLFGFGHTNSQHIGIIEKKNSDGTYTCIEGNTSTGNNCNGGMVMRRKRYKSQINWIVRPKYKTETITPVAKPTTKYTGEIPIPTLRRGNKGQEVKELQLFLNWYGARSGEATGKFGKTTEKAQKVFQKSEGGSTTGVYGETSYKKALKYVDKEEKETTVKDKEVYYHKDQKKAQCVITSMVNAMRRYMIQHDKKWENITITNAKKQGAKQSGYSCHFNGVKFKVHYCKWDKSKRTAENLRALLKKHPEGVSIFGAKTSFARKKSGTAHGILITHYANGHFYGVNPSHNGKRYGYTKKTGKGIERFDKMNMSTNLKRYSRISYLEVKK